MSRLIIFVVLIASFILGWITLQHQVTFGYDQSRDAFESLSIVRGDIKIIGPMTDIPGVFHGVLYYYFLAVLYGLFRGDPQLVATVYFFLSFLTIPLVGYLAQQLFKKKDVTLVAMALYAFSPLFLAFSRWLSNPGPAILVTPLLLLALWQYLMKRDVRLAVAIGVGYGLLIQFNLAYGLLLVLLPVYVVVFKSKPRLFDYLGLIGGLLITSASYFLAEIRFHGRGITGMLSFLTDSDKTSKPFLERIDLLVTKTTEFFSLSFANVSSALVLVFLVLVIGGVWWKRKKIDRKPLLFLVIWITNVVFFLLFNTGISTSSFMFGPTIAAFLILIAYFFTLLPRFLMIIVVVLIVLVQCSTTLGWYSRDFTPLSIQIGDTVPIEKQVIAYTYAAAEGKPFVIRTVTVPLYVNTTWAYLYKFSQKDYGYVPYWDGPDQTGYPGAEMLPVLPQDTDVTTVFLIIEPTEGIPDYFIQQIRDDEASKSTIVETKKIGNYVIERRERTSKNNS